LKEITVKNVKNMIRRKIFEYEMKQMNAEIKNRNDKYSNDKLGYSNDEQGDSREVNEVRTAMEEEIKFAPNRIEESGYYKDSPDTYSLDTDSPE
jgi:hypothetical protein